MGEKAPDPGWTTRGVISRVIDGDTVEVEITRKIVVRLRDCWAPEKRLDPSLPEIDRNAAKLRGVASAVHLQSLAEGQACTVLLFYTLYLYQQGFEFFRMGYASALAWVLLIIISIFTAIYFYTSKYWVYYESEK